MRKFSRIITVILLITAMLLPLTVETFAAGVEVSSGMVQNSQDLPRLDIYSDADLDSTIYKSKDNKVDASAKITGAESDAHNLAESYIELKTRGNTTWGVMKWAYQIKFDKKVDLFDMGKAKKWILLANYYDGTFVRNKVIFDLGKEIGIPYVVESVFVELYINNEYRGVYQLCEKVELGSSRIDIDSDYGVLLEMDASNRQAELDKEIYFTTATTGKPMVYKEYNTDFEDEAEADKVAEIRQFTENHINTLEARLYSDDADWETIESLIDVDSFILYYFITEFTMEVDATYSSTFFYIDGPGDVLHCGPLWDYDRIMGWDTSYDQTTDNDYLKNITDSTDEYRVEWFKMLFRHPEFVQRVNEIYDEKIRDAFNTEKVIGMFDYYQQLLWPALEKNHNKYQLVFHNRSYIVEDVFSGTMMEQIEYTTNCLKQWLTERNEYLETAYGIEHPTLTYQVYDNYAGWQSAYTGGCMTYSSDALTAIKMEIIDSIFDGGIEYSFAKSGAISSPAADGEELHTSGYSRFSGIFVELTGNLANYFGVQYRVYRNGSWSSWASDGDLAGAMSSSNYITRIQVRLIQYANAQYSNVSFVSEVGEAPAAVYDVMGNSVELESIEAEGYIFEGWYASPDFSGEAITSLTVGEEDTVLYAKMIPDIIPGDVDGDGDITMLDLYMLKSFLKLTSVPTEKQISAADIDGDGDLTMVDSYQLRYRVAYGTWK